MKDRLVNPKHILLIIREIINFIPDNKATDVDCALRFLNDAIKKKAKELKKAWEKFLKEQKRKNAERRKH